MGKIWMSFVGVSGGLKGVLRDCLKKLRKERIHYRATPDKYAPVKQKTDRFHPDGMG